MISDILVRVQALLDRANREAIDVPDEVLDEFAAMCRAAFAKQFKEGPANKFTIRMSNMGKPLCQLQREASGEKSSPPPYSHRMKMLIGDVTEAASVAIMRLAGVNVQAVGQPVSLQLLPKHKSAISGTYDVKIDGVIYDIKSASPYSFTHKFSDYTALASDDSFGYLAQGYGYGAADGARFGGWIVIDKSTGEWAVLETPTGEAYDTEATKALSQARDNVTALLSNAEFKRCFEDVPEVYYKKETGNRVLPFNCDYCGFKSRCWPDAKTMPQLVSKGQSPKRVSYTHIDPKYLKEGEYEHHNST